MTLYGLTGRVHTIPVVSAPVRRRNEPMSDSDKPEDAPPQPAPPSAPVEAAPPPTAATPAGPPKGRPGPRRPPGGGRRPGGDRGPGGRGRPPGEGKPQRPPLESVEDLTARGPKISDIDAEIEAELAASMAGFDAEQTLGDLSKPEP